MQDLSPYLSTLFPTAQDIKDFVNGQTYPLRVRPAARLLAGDLTPIVLAHPPNPDDTSDISELIEKCVVRCNEQQDVQREVDLTMHELPDITEVNTLTDLIQIFVDFYDETGASILKVPVGIFSFDIPDRTLSDATNMWSIKGYDLTSRISKLWFQDTYTIPAGFKITDAVKAILAADKLPPSQGGRPPSGIPWPGTPQANQPVNTGTPYCTSGVACTSLGTTNSSGYQVMPDSTTIYNPYSGARVDPTTYAPIDPWSCTPMTQLYNWQGAPVAGFFICNGITNTWYSTYLGAFIVPTSLWYQNPSTVTLSVLDIFKNVVVFTTTLAAPASHYKSPVNLTGDNCALATWPYDYDGSGPYFQPPSGGGGGGSTTPSLEAPAFRPTVAPNPTLGCCMTAGDHTYAYAWDFGGGKPGPLGPGSTVVLPNNGAVNIAVPGSPTITGGPTGSTGLLLYRLSTLDGKYYQVPGWPEHSGSSPFTDTFYDGSLSIAYSPIQPPPAQPPAGTPPPTTTGTVGGVWPDTNNPGLTPSGCDDPGPNIPLSRIQIVDSDIVAPQPFTFSRKINKLAAINSLLEAINYWPIWVDEHGIFHSEPQPYFNNFIPNAEWVYSTFPLPDGTSSGTIKPGVTVRIADVTQLANVIQVISEKNTSVPIVSVKYNTSPNSMISINNLGYVIEKHIQDDKIVDQSVADFRAFVELQFAALGAEAVQFVVHVNPFHQVHDYIELNVYTPDGATIEVDSTTYPFMVNTWELDMAKREQTIVAGRTVAV